MNNTDNHAELRRLLSDTTLCNEVIDSLQTHYMLQMMALLVFVIRILKYMDFQPRLGIITRTLRVAAVDMFHFGIVSFRLTVLLVFAMHSRPLALLQTARTLLHE